MCKLDKTETLVTIVGLNIFISENNIHGNYNIVIYINIIGLERKQYSLFGSSPEVTIVDMTYVREVT